MKSIGPATNLILRPKEPIGVKSFQPPVKADLEGQISFKYADYHKALDRCTPYVRNIIESVPLSRGFKYTLVDVKVMELKRGQLPCLPGWHLDCTMHPMRKEKHEVHHLFVWGADCRTRFITSPISIPILRDRLVNINEAVRSQMPDIYQIEDCTLTRYGRFNLHAPSEAGRDGTRLLIRVTENDFIRPKVIRGTK